MFGHRLTLASFLVNAMLRGHAAYRRQSFCYLKAISARSLNILALWTGVDEVT
jgi:hypothetical protein